MWNYFIYKTFKRKEPYLINGVNNMSTGKVLSRREYRKKKGKQEGRKKNIRTVVLCAFILVVLTLLTFLFLKPFLPG